MSSSNSPAAIEQPLDDLSTKTEASSTNKNTVLRISFTVLFALFALCGAVILGPKENREKAIQFLGLQQGEEAPNVDKSSSPSSPPAIQPNSVEPAKEEGALGQVKDFFSSLHAKTSKHYKDVADTAADIGKYAGDVKKEVEQAHGTLQTKVKEVRRLPLVDRRYFWGFIGAVVGLVLIAVTVFLALFFTNPPGKQLGVDVAETVEEFVTFKEPPKPLIPLSVSVFLGFLGTFALPLIIVGVVALVTKSEFFAILSEQRWIYKLCTVIFVGLVVSASIALQLAGSTATLSVSIVLLVLTFAIYIVAFIMEYLSFEEFADTFSSIYSVIFSEGISWIYRLLSFLVVSLPIMTVSLGIVTALYELNLVAVFNFVIDTTFTLAFNPIYLYMAILGLVAVLLLLACIFLKPVRKIVAKFFILLAQNAGWRFIASIVVSVLLCVLLFVAGWGMLIAITVVFLIMTIYVIYSFEFTASAEEEGAERDESDKGPNGFIKWSKYNQSKNIFLSNVIYVELFVVSILTIICTSTLLPWTVASLPVFLSFLFISFVFISAKDSKHFSKWIDEYFPKEEVEEAE